MDSNLATSLQLVLVKTYFRSAGRLAPRLVGRQAFRLCFTPMLRPGVEEMTRTLMARTMLDRAERLPVELEGRQLRTYRWSVGTNPPIGTVLLVHGWNSRAARMTPWVEPLLARRFDVVAFDMPAHGDSDGKRTDGLDMAKAVGAVAEVAGPLHGVVSHSAGAFASAMAIAGGHLLGRPAVSAERLVMIAPVDNPLILMSGFATALGLSDGTREELLRAAVEEFGHPMEDFSLSNIPGGWNQPTLLVHDPDDSEVPYAESESVAACRPNATLIPIPGLGHHRIARHPRVISLATGFLTDRNPDSHVRMSATETTGRAIPGGRA